MSRKLIVLLAAPTILGAQQVTDTTFHPVSQAEAVQMAQRNNLSAITSANAVRSANNQVRAARAAVLPSLSASAGQSKSAGDRLGQSGTIVPYTSQWTYSTGLSSDVTLFDAGKMFTDISARKADVVAQEAAEVTTQFSLAYQVKTQYNAILAANEQESAGRAQLALAQEQLDVSIAKVNAGTANMSDSLRSVVAVGNAQIAIMTAQQNLRSASASLTRLVGTPYLVTANAADTIDHVIAPVDSAMVMQLSATGPQIRQSEAQLNSAKASIKSAKTAYLPTVSASLSFGGNGTGTYGFGGDPFPYTRGISLRASYQIFNRFTRENQIQSAQIAYDNAQATIRDNRLAAQQTAITQLGLLKNAQEQIRVQETSVRASEEDLRVNQERYKLGASTILDVLTSQSNLVSARQQLIQARLNYRNARAQLEAVIGRDLP